MSVNTENNTWTLVGQSRQVHLLATMKEGTHATLRTLAGHNAEHLQGDFWQVLQIVDKSVQRFQRTRATFLDKNGKRVLRNVARISILRFLENCGLDLDQVTVYHRGGEYTRRQMVLSKEFERALISQLRANFEAARRNLNVPEWKRIYVRRHSGEKPDLVVELSFDPEYHHKVSNLLPEQLKVQPQPKAQQEPMQEAQTEDFPELQKKEKPKQSTDEPKAVNPPKVSPIDWDNLQEMGSWADADEEW